ncbi:metal-dependent transcriptional regulator [Corynebacterium hindlerae]|uniref:metal-dependent transcriptional regulator n=1 Tax=Corynebacterium hindlerae TaxID=699041 RepID=UPI001AD7E343|nr:metal-dependent transcriptional regulator [Corynebacterium hindlerae]QTH60123.1 metal-dependent transcriptional regulator [Corynebacterium hindlerae]
MTNNNTQPVTSLEELSASHQNYVKALWGLQEWSVEPVTKTALAQQVGVKLSTASDAVRKLQELKLVNDTRYGAVTLTETGRQLAIQMVRRHRLIEAFLVSALDFEWDQVHAEAEVLEHAVSDFLVDRIEEKLGFPDRDPHGDPIPSRDGSVDRLEAVALSEVPAGSVVTVERISDADPALLRYFSEQGIVVGAALKVSESGPFSGSVAVTVGDRNVQLALGVARGVWVRVD